jgi:predicted component of type VI protein secretion system
MRLPRTTGAVTGMFILLLGVWGALIPFIGPYFHYAFGNYDAWHYTANRLWLDILPGAVAALGGLLLLTSSRRTSGVLGGGLAVAAGAWFAIGPSASLLWHHAGNRSARRPAAISARSLSYWATFTPWASSSSCSEPLPWVASSPGRVWPRSRSWRPAPWPARGLNAAGAAYSDAADATRSKSLTGRPGATAK